MIILSEKGEEEEEEEEDMKEKNSRTKEFIGKEKMEVHSWMRKCET